MPPAPADGHNYSTTEFIRQDLHREMLTLSAAAAFAAGVRFGAEFTGVMPLAAMPRD